MTALFGIGGGLVLVAVLSFLLPAKDLIPIHGLVQLASNSSRALFSYRSIKRAMVMPFLLGSALGTLAFGAILPAISLPMLLIVIAVYILLSQWVPWIQRVLLSRLSLFWGGFFCTGLGLLVGANGPLVASVMGQRVGNKNELVATAAVFILIGHLYKVAWFGAKGFDFVHYGWIVVLLVGAVIVGSFVGTKIRHRVSEQAHQAWLKGILTLLAIAMLFNGIWEMLG